MNDALDVPPVPSGSTLTSEIEIEGPSSSTIVPMPWESAIVAFDAPLRFTVYVSSTSSTPSPLTVTVTVLVVWPGEKLSGTLPVAV